MIWINIDKTKNVSLTKQIFEQIRSKILKKELVPGEKLPSTRKLASELNVSRNIILTVYDQLNAEGYLDTHNGSGTYIATGTFLTNYIDSYKHDSNKKINKKKTLPNNKIISFEIGIPDLKSFPIIIWSKLIKEASLDITEKELNYPDIKGFYKLRSELAKYLLKTKGIVCNSEQIIIISGSIHAFFILGELFKTSNKSIIIEDPSYMSIYKIFDKLEFNIIPISVDEMGINTDLILGKEKIGSILVTPSHQYPSGSVLPIQRRIKLIEFAQKNQIYIIENDYDSEFRYTSPPINSLHLLDPERVIHIGTFSETLFPSLRLGYMVLPVKLIEKVCEIKSIFGLYTSTIKQIALSNFISKGHFELHVAKMKKKYQKKNELLKNILKNYFGKDIEISGDSTGLYLVIEFKNIKLNNVMMNKIHKQDVKVERIKNHSINNSEYDNKILLGYGNLSMDKILEGIKRIKKALFS